MRYHVMKRSLHAPPLPQDMGQMSGRGSVTRDHTQNTTAGSPAYLTGRDAEILCTLALKVRCLSVALVAEAWWPRAANGIKAAHQRLRCLARQGWLIRISSFAKPLPSLKLPVAMWSPGDEMPNFGPISYRLKTRFEKPAQATTIFCASPKTTKRFGGGNVRRPRSSEVSHDLGLAAVYLGFRSDAAERAARWISEAAIVAQRPARGVKVPDAAILERDGTVTAIEFGGEYDKSKLVAFHQFCAGAGQGYEIW